MSKKFSHIKKDNTPGMVDVGSKDVSSRTAVAIATINLGERIIEELINEDIHTKKGPVFQTAIIAGTMAVKKTSELIPFCHPLQIERCTFDIQISESNAIIKCEVGISGKTGVEMEALTGASVAALTVYDMCKSMNKEMIIKDVKLISKKGGKSDFFIDE